MSNVLIGKPAPKFSAKAVINGQIEGDFSLSKYLGKYIVFFFYPLDFTFVCPTELHAFQEKLMDFQNRGAVVVGCSVDSCFSHLAWLSTPKCKGGIEGVGYHLVSDMNKTISKDFQVLKEDEGISYRGLFILDQKGIVRHQVINDLPIGRSVDEALRTLDAIIFHDKNGEVCPANWKAGAKSMKPTSEGLEAYFHN
ncbi:MAG: peroxiredoxin [Chlamydiae bacterium]|nr:peroxiredoxin [Chlamydiota bacterium]